MDIAITNEIAKKLSACFCDVGRCSKWEATAILWLATVAGSVACTINSGRDTVFRICCLTAQRTIDSMDAYTRRLCYIFYG